jgi:predicted regulator of Ras-like GTPase activity (Roadblock/LC7/MglB family)
MAVQVPKVLYENNVAEILSEMRTSYGTLTRAGYVYGLIAVDEDAKIIAVDPMFDADLNYWELSSLGAALYGVARQGQDFFEADYLDRATIIYNNMRLFVKSIADVRIDSSTKREILIILLSNDDVNIGVMVLQMARFADRIKKAIEGSVPIKNTLKMKEDELKDHIKTLKKDLFGDTFGSAE